MASAHSPAKLMQLSQAKHLSIFDDHDGGIGYVDTHFHNRSADKDIYLSFLEGRHHSFLFTGRHLSVHKTNAKAGQGSGGQPLEGCHC